MRELIIQKLLLITRISDQIEVWNEKLNAITSKYMNNAIFAGVIVIVLFIFSCWVISYLTKK